MSELEQIGEEWSNIDIEINNLKKTMKELNEKKKDLTNKLMEKMVTNNKNEIQLKDCLITLKSIVKPAEFLITNLQVLEGWGNEVNGRPNQILCL